MKISVSCLLSLAFIATSHAFVLPRSTFTSTTTLYSTKSSKSDTVNNVEDMKKDIEAMRQEAIRRLDRLNEQCHDVLLDEKLHQQEAANGHLLEVTSKDDEIEVVDFHRFFNEADEGDRLLEARMERDAIAHEIRRANEQEGSSRPSLNLLDQSRWRLMLNIGRETGTWMPKTWGVSGERLFLNLELEFTPEQLYEREEFLNGVTGAKVLKVVHDEAMMAPSMQEGGRKVRVRKGGWRVAPGEGPLGTSVLRFYFELEEEVRHQGSDVYCPAGRVYCTCGYFPMSDRHGSLKESLRDEMHELEAKYEKLAGENELDHSLVSWEKMQRSKQMMEMRMQANTLKQKMNEAHVQEPDKSLLRLSRDQSVGLTREGGVCCKVHKGLAIEYHILGKFEVAGIDNREHSDYRELLP